MGFSRAYAKQRGSLSTLLLAAPLVMALSNPAMVGDSVRALQDNVASVSESVAPSIQVAAMDFGTNIGTSIGGHGGHNYGSAHFISGGPIYLPEG
jgi:predicted MFS family arabinose efflux permease